MKNQNQNKTNTTDSKNQSENRTENQNSKNCR